LGGGVGFAAGFVDSGEDEVFEECDVASGRAGGRGVDGDLLDDLLAVHADGDGAAAGGGFHGDVGQFGVHLVFHGLGLGEEFAHFAEVHCRAFRDRAALLENSNAKGAK